MLPSYESYVPHNVDTLPDVELKFLDYSSVADLRNAQDTYLRQAVDSAGIGLDDITAIAEEIRTARSNAIANYDDLTKHYLLQFIDEDNLKFEEYFNKLREFSTDNMSLAELSYGPLLPDGTRDDSRAGWRLLHTYRTSEATADMPDTDIDDSDAIADLSERITELNEQLDIARGDYAKKQVSYRHKLGWMGGKKKLALAEAKQIYDDLQRELASATIQKAREDNPGLTNQEVKVLAQTYVATEFGKLATEQSKPEYISGKYGRSVRKIGNLSLKKKVLLSITAIGAGTAAALTGGVVAGAAFGLLGAYRGTRSVFSGTLGHSNERGSAKVIKKLADKKLKQSNQNISATTEAIDDDRFTEIVTDNVNAFNERIHKSDRARRIGSAAITAASIMPLVGGIIYRMSKANDAKDIITGSGSGVPGNGNSIPGTGSGSTGSEFIPSPPATPDVITGIPNLTPEEWSGLQYLDMQNVTGGHPWTRAMDYFGGNGDAANKWLQEAVVKAGGEWHNTGDGISTNDWISINGRSDTAYVWQALTQAHPAPRP